MVMTIDELKKSCIKSGRSLQWMLSVLSEEEVLLRLSQCALADSAIVKGEYVIQSLGGSEATLLPRLEMAVCLPEGTDLVKEIMGAGEQEMQIVAVTEAKRMPEWSDAEVLYVVKTVFHGISTAFYMNVIYFENGEDLKNSIYGISSTLQKDGLPRLSGIEGTIHVLYMCPEGIFSERYLAAVRSGELVDSMETWYDMFCIITTFILDGHRIGEIMERLSVTEDIARMEDLKGIASLGDRWRALARQQKVPLKGFPDLADFIYSVIGPVAEAVKSGNEFFGQWMPELCRYID